MTATNKPDETNKMGSSQSKFKPEIHDIWYKTRVTGGQPVFLQCVLQAIVDLKESQGSSQGRIIDYIQSIINEKNIRPRPRNVVMQIKRALKYAIENGMIRQRGGKFVMVLSDKEFTIFKGFRSTDPTKECVKHRKPAKYKSSQTTRRQYTKPYKRRNFEYERGKSTETKRHGKRKRRLDSNSDTDHSSNLENLCDLSEQPSTSYKLNDSKRNKRRKNNYESCSNSEQSVDSRYTTSSTGTNKENAEEPTENHQYFGSTSRDGCK